MVVVQLALVNLVVLSTLVELLTLVDLLTLGDRLPKLLDTELLDIRAQPTELSRTRQA